MMGFLNSAMGLATSRFITINLGKGSSDELTDTFSTAFFLHLAIAVIILLVGETIGLWFLNAKLVIHPDRMDAARFVYQFSLLSTFFSITQVPYNSTIIAHEKMDVYAGVEIMNVSLKLLIVYILQIGDFDKLKLYSVLVFFVSILIMMVYRGYCISHFKESHLKMRINKAKAYEMAKYSGWSFLNNMSTTAENQGINFLLNIFFGTIANAAASIATTVNGMIVGFSSNICIAFAPQITKKYAVSDYAGCIAMLSTSIKYTLLFFQMLMVPCWIECELLLQLWLGQVPQFTVDFVRLIILVSFINTFSRIINDGINATGQIMFRSILTCVFSLSTLIISYFALKNGLPAHVVYYSMSSTHFFILISNVAILRVKIRQINILGVIKSMLIVMLVFVFNFAFCFFAEHLFPNYLSGFLRLVTICAISLLLTAALSYSAVLTDAERIKVRSFINKIRYKHG